MFAVSCDDVSKLALQFPRVAFQSKEKLRQKMSADFKVIFGILITLSHPRFI